MARKKKHPEHVNHERWLISYADFITLLFAFFVVLFSSSQVDNRKVGKISKAVQVAFEDLGMFPASGTRVPVSDDAPVPFNSIQTIQSAEHTGSLGRFVPNAQSRLGGAPDETTKAELQKQVEKTLQKELGKQEVHLRSGPDGLIISLGEVGFFDSGSAHLKDAALPTVAKIAATLQSNGCMVQIEGHSDSIPIHNAQYASNWELSTARATELTRLLIEKYGIPPGRLSAAGYAEYHPIAENDTEEGRTLNRRVDIILRTPSPSPSPSPGQPSGQPLGASLPPAPTPAPPHH